MFCEVSRQIENAKTLLRERISEIDRERRQLDKALKALSGQTERSRTAPTPRRRRGASATTAQAVADYLKANPQATTSEVVQALGLKDGRVVGAQRRRLASG